MAIAMLFTNPGSEDIIYLDSLPGILKYRKSIIYILLTFILFIN